VLEAFSLLIILKHWHIVALLYLLYFSGQISAASVSGPIRICDDLGEWPPFVYFERQNGVKSDQLGGMSVKLVQIIMGHYNLEYSLELLPWKRCLMGVQEGRYHMLLNATENEERLKNYWPSVAYSQISPYYFFLQGQQSAPTIKRREDLANYRVGGILGYNYEYYGLHENQVTTQGIYNYENLLARLQLGQFDIFVENIEILAGFNAVGEPYLLRKNLAYRPIPGMPPTEIYMLFTRNEEGKELRNRVNQVIEILEQNGEMNRLRQKYLVMPD